MTSTLQRTQVAVWVLGSSVLGDPDAILEEDEDEDANALEADDDDEG